jgi:hypothetical protein
MIIEAVIVSVNYGDFLEESIKENQRQLDRIVVVTSPHDKHTQSVCNKFGVDFVISEEHKSDGDAFNKGRLINLGLSHLKNTDWLLHIYADVVLPHNFRHMLKHAKLSNANIYGADRVNTVSYEHYHRHKDESYPQHQWRYLTVANPHFPMGARLVHKEYGYCPIGYFQLWHSSTGIKYPIYAGSAEHSDVLFAVQWNRHERILLPEFFVYHLESEQVPMGHNWHGRKTKPFKPEPREYTR